MPNALSPLMEQRVVAFALGHPGFGPAQIAAELARPLRGALRLSPNGVWRALDGTGSTPAPERLGLVAAGQRSLEIATPQGSLTPVPIWTGG